ncbi:MAG: hypothetical protein V3T86_01055 [Planctomycetota bacterium]
MKPGHVRILTLLALTGLVLSWFQCWVAYWVSPDDAPLLWCVFSETFDCNMAVHVRGATLELGGMRILPAVTALWLCQAAMLLYARLAAGSAGQGLQAWARVLALPILGLGLFGLLNDVLLASEHLAAGETSAPTQVSISGLLILACAAVSALLAVLHGPDAAALKLGVARGLPLLLGAFLFGVFLQGASSARLETRELTDEAETRPPNVRFPTFAEAMPRFGAAAMGEESAEREALFFLDPDNEESRKLLRELLEVQPARADLVRTVVYLRGKHAAGLAAAVEFGAGRDYLQAVLDAPGEPDDLVRRLGGNAVRLVTPTIRGLVKRQQRRIVAAGIEKFPTVWTQAGKKTGNLSAKAVLESVARAE